MKILKLLKILLIILAILVVIAISIIIILNIKKIYAQKTYDYSTMGVYKDAEYKEEKNLKYENISLLKNFQGTMPTSSITSSINEIFVKKIPETINVVELFSETELIKYYNDNRDKIRKNLRISTQEIFLNMIAKVKNISCNLETDYEICKFFEENNSIKFKFIYENDQEIECEIIGNNANNFMLSF